MFKIDLMTIVTMVIISMPFLQKCQVKWTIFGQIVQHLLAPFPFSVDLSVCFVKRTASLNE